MTMIIKCLLGLPDSSCLHRIVFLSLSLGTDETEMKTSGTVLNGSLVYAVNVFPYSSERGTRKKGVRWYAASSSSLRKRTTKSNKIRCFSSRHIMFFCFVLICWWNHLEHVTATMLWWLSRKKRSDVRPVTLQTMRLKREREWASGVCDCESAHAVDLLVSLSLLVDRTHEWIGEKEFKWRRI